MGRGPDDEDRAPWPHPASLPGPHRRPFNTTHLAPGTDPVDLMRGWLDAGVSLVILTAGSRPTRAWTRSAAASFEPPPVPVSDTIGAGDSFMAALLADLHHTNRLSAAAIDALDDAALDRILGWAAAAATHTVQQAGANPPWSTDLPAPA